MPPKPLAVLDTTTTDNYQYLDCPNSTRLSLQISGNMILIGYGMKSTPQGSPEYPPQDEPFLPVVGEVPRPQFDQIRVKSYTPGKPADVKIRAL